MTGTLGERLATGAGLVRAAVRNELVYRGRQLGLGGADTGRLAWLFVATLPNSGSTALASLLLSASRAVHLHYNSEGQWLIPQISRSPRRWDPSWRVDLGRVRAVWVDAALRRKPGEVVVVEKSPPNLARFRQIRAVFADMPSWGVRFSRDPYAICASWAKRYPDMASRRRAADEFEALGAVCGQRYALLAGLDDAIDLDLSYEGLAADVPGSIDKVRRLVPALADIDPGADVAVKDYERQPIQDMNAAQIAMLSAEGVAAISRGLEPHRAAVERFGYALR